MVTLFEMNQTINTKKDEIIKDKTETTNDTNDINE